MKKLGFLLLFATFFTTGVNFIMAQNDDNHDILLTVPEVALLDIETTGGSTTISLGPSAPSEAGDPLNFSAATNNSLWINYSSITNSANGETSRTVSTEVTSGSIPSGMTLDLVVGDATTTNSGGTLGTVINGGTPYTFGSGAQTIINNIGSCYTGSPANNGHQLTYSLAMDAGNYADLDASTSSITITYTLSDN